MMGKTTCFTGESIADCFAIEESDVGLTMSNHGAEYCLRICDLAIEKDVMLITDSIMLGRTIIENIRKFLQYQLTVAVNLFLYIIIGSSLTNEVPVPPSVILFINFVMDTLSSNIFSKELPEHNLLILEETIPISPTSNRLFTQKMVFNFIVCTVYQQGIMFYFYYRLWYDKYQMNKDKVVKSDEFYQDETSAFHTFFLMQVVNIFICRITYEPLNVF